MLGNSYITLAGVTLFNPRGTSEEWERIEDEYTTEAGNEYVLVRSDNKLRLGLRFNCSSRAKNTLLTAYKGAGAVSMTYLGTTYGNCFITSFSAELVQDSERTPNTDGLWEVELTVKTL